MNKRGIGIIILACLLGVIFILVSFVSSASASKIDGVVKFRGYQYFAYSDGERSEIYINKNGEVNLQRPSFGGMLTDYFVFDKKIGIVSADPAGNFILLDSTLKDFIGEELFNQIDGREISENGLVGEQAESVELTINTNGVAVPTGIIADGRGYLRPKNNLKETVGTIDKTGKISMYNPSSYSTASKTSLSRVASQIQNTRATRGTITDLTKVSSEGWASRSANARTTSSNNIMDRIGRAAGGLIDKVTGERPKPTPPEIPGIKPSPKPGVPGIGPVAPSPKPTNKTAPTPKPRLGKPNVINDINCDYASWGINANSLKQCSCDTTIAYVTKTWKCLKDGIMTGNAPPAYKEFNCVKPNGDDKLQMIWKEGVNNCCTSNADCDNKPKPYKACDTQTGQCVEHKPCHK